MQQWPKVGVFMKVTGFFQSFPLHYLTCPRGWHTELGVCFALWFVHGVLEKGIRNIWSHIPWSLQRIRNLLMQRRSQGIVNPEARTHVRIAWQEGSCCSQLVWHLVHVNSRIVSHQKHGRKRPDCLETESEELSTESYAALVCNNWVWIWWQWQFLQPYAPNLCQVSWRTYDKDRKSFIWEIDHSCLGWIPHFSDAGETFLGTDDIWNVQGKEKAIWLLIAITSVFLESTNTKKQCYFWNHVFFKDQMFSVVLVLEIAVCFSLKISL